MSSVLGACRLCEAPMSAHVFAGVWIGCSPSPFLFASPTLAIDLTIAALERQRHPEAEPVGQVASEDRAAAAYARQRLSPSEVHQSVPSAHCEG